MDACFLIEKQKRLSKNRLTVPLCKLCTQLSTKIVDNYLQRDGRSRALSSPFCFLSLNLPRLTMRFKVARFFKCFGVELATYHRSGRMADLATYLVLDHHSGHHR